MKLLRIALLIAFPSLIFAQTNYHQGYVLKNNGDTLKGYIDYREWTYSPLSIDFKVNKTDKAPQQFTPKAIKGFEITDMETYASYIGVISTNKNIFPNLPVGLDTGKIQAAVFLKQLTTGNHLTLFFNNEINKNRFFIAENGKPPVELIYYEYYDNTRTQEVYHNLYRGQLLLYINQFNNGNAKLVSKLEDVKFTQPDLVNIVDDINNDGARTSNDQIGTKKRPSNTRFFAGAGINNTTTKYTYVNSITGDISSTGTVITDHMLSYQSTTVSPKIDLGLDIFVNPNVQQFIFRLELAYSYVNGRFTGNVEQDGNTIDVFDYQFGQHTATLTPQFIFNVYNQDKLKVYVDAGVAVNLSGYTNTAPVNELTGTNLSPLTLRPLWAYYPMQVGVVLNKKIEFSFTYNLFAGYSSYSDVSIANSSMCLGVKYLFGGK